MVLHHGPTDEECANLDSPVAGEGPCAFESAEEPTCWKAKDFSIDNWQPAKEFSEREVRPKDGYDRFA